MWATALAIACASGFDDSAEYGGPSITVVTHGQRTVDVGYFWQVHSCYLTDGIERCTDQTASYGPVDDGRITVGAPDWEDDGESWLVVAHW